MAEKFYMTDEIRQTITDFFAENEDFCLSDPNKPIDPSKAKIKDEHDFFQVVRRGSNWRPKLTQGHFRDFHFQIAWYDSLPVTIYAFLSVNDKETVDFFRENAKHFEKQADSNSKYHLFTQYLPCDFSTPDSTRESLEIICAVLKSKPFQDIADIADKYFDSEQ